MAYKRSDFYWSENGILKHEDPIFEKEIHDMACRVVGVIEDHELERKDFEALFPFFRGELNDLLQKKAQVMTDIRNLKMLISFISKNMESSP